MKLFSCEKCGSIDVFVKKRGNQTGLYCGDCGKWIKWLTKDEIRLVERQISKLNKVVNQMECDVNTSQEIKDYYGNRLQKAFHNLVLCKNYDKENPLAIDNYTIIIHPNKLCDTFYDFTSANNKYEVLKWAAEAKIQIDAITKSI